MSDTDVDYGPEDPSDFIAQDQRRTVGSALTSLGDDPEQASQSYELGRATGQPPAVIYPNLENYQEQHRAKLVASLLQSNKYLRQYIDEDPMRAKLSSDDWGNLDAASESISKLSLPMRALRFPEEVGSGIAATAGSIAQGIISGYRKGAIAGGGIGDWAFAAPGAADHPLYAALQGIGWAPWEIASRFLSGSIEGATEGAHEGAKTFAKQFGASDMAAERFARDIAAMTEAEVTGLSGRHPVHGPDGTPEPFKPQGPEKKIIDMATAARPWLDDGREPPAGLHPEIDKLKFEQNKIDVDNLDEALKASVSSATRERSPDVYRDFVRSHTDGDIGISADAVASLYGDKVPEAEDGILGFVPGIADQLEAAKASGGDVRVPLADWLAKVDPEVAKELHDDIRVRPGGITKAEKDALGEAKDQVQAKLDETPTPEGETAPTWKPAEPLPEPLPQARAAAGLEPMFSVGDRKLELKRDPVKDKSLNDPAIPADMFHLLDENGEKRGWLRVVPFENGKKLYIDNIGGKKGANMFGPALTRDIARQLKEEYPEAEQIGGFRVSGAREKAETEREVWVKFDQLDANAEDLHQIVNGGRDYKPLGQGLEAAYKPTELLTEHEHELSQAIQDAIDQIAPRGADVSTPSAIRRSDTKQNVRGAFMQYENRNPLIIVALDSNDPIGVARHEAIHHLRRSGFFTEGEWGTLERAARDEGWVKKFGIDTRYASLDNASKLEEAIADGYRAWAKGGDALPKFAPIFERIKQLFETIKQKFAEVLGKDVSWEDLFGKVERGEVGAREGTEPLDPKAHRESVEDEAPFDRGSIMPKEQFDLYMKNLQARHDADLKLARDRATAEQAKRQTKEWKDNAKLVHDEVAKDIAQRPDVAADLFFGAGEYLGEKVGKRPKLGAEYLSPEQKAALPKDYIAKDGMNPDDAANLFGYPSGDAMIAKLADYNTAKQAANMSAKDFVSRITDLETERQMVARHGTLEKSIREEAEDQAVSETQLNLLHQETLALALQNGADGKIDKGQLKSWVQEKVSGTPISAIKFDDYMSAAGRAGRTAEMALLKQDYAEAFRAKQQQYLAMLFAKEAKDLEKARASFDKIAKRYSKREVAGASPEYTDAVHDILQRLGEGVRRSIQDVAESYKLNGHEGLRDFVATKEAQLRDLHTPDFLQDPAFRKPTDDLTAEEFEQVHDALKAITHNSRDELKVNAAGEKADLKVVLDEMIAKIKSLGDAKLHPRDEGTISKHVKNYWWAGITVESMLHRLDRGDRSGPFYQYLTHHFTEAANYKDKLIKDFQKKIAAVGKIEDMDKQVENKTFKNPETGEYFPLRRRNVLGILQNAGNKNNLMKLAKGYDLEPSQVLDWLHANTTKEDWDRAQKIGDTFNEIFDMANTMSHTISGVGIQRLPLEPIDTPHGTYAGWYNPIKYDPFIPGKSKKLMGPNPLEEEGFYRATTPQGYTKQRTGYIAPVELSLDIVPQRMKQMLHDIAMRPAILQMSKFFYDSRFQRAMNNYYGSHQAQSMIPFLQDIANAPNFKSMTAQLGDQAMEFMRQNMITTLIGFNPGTVMKHGATAWINSMTEVGAKAYLTEFKNIVAETTTGRDTWKTAMDKSEELQRRMRNFQELMQGHGSEINLRGAQSKFMSLREMVMNAGAKPVSFSDLLSAVPTWSAKYKSEIANGTDEGMAVSLANAAVRAAHGSSVISNKPAIARTNALGATFSSLYGFFSHMQQKQYQLAWQARDMIAGQRPAAQTVPDLVGGLFSYVIAPAVIEELVTPSTTDDHKSWGRHAAETLAMGVSSSFIGVRDFVRAAINLRDPQAGLVGTSIKTATDLGRDLGQGKAAFTKEKAANLLKHTFALNGALTGLTNEQEGKMAEYMYNYFHGREHPKGPWDAAVGLRYGSSDKHSHSFADWQKQTLGGR